MSYLFTSAVVGKNVIQLLPVGIDDLAAARRELKDVEVRWKDIGLELGIRVLRLDAIETEATDCMERLTKMLTMWLRLDYSFEKHQRPSWRRLVEAVAQSTGGGDRRLAMEIAKRHPGSVCRNHTTLEYIVVRPKKFNFLFLIGLLKL